MIHAFAASIALTRILGLSAKETPAQTPARLTHTMPYGRSSFSDGICKCVTCVLSSEQCASGQSSSFNIQCI
ncbi:hypothetical protein DFS33DRAFT_979879 [Desarmillaria ectypa]|nr:hypothetical protein DFS33DRAFT_979879 [Desarmillaria ectypa]